MKPLDLDALFAIAEAGPALDVVEEKLRLAGKTTEADQLLKLQQDAGLGVDREMGMWVDGDPAPGEATARLRAAYEPVTVDRMSVFYEIRQFLQPAEVSSLEQLTAKLPKMEAGSGKSNLTPPQV